MRPEVKDRIFRIVSDVCGVPVDTITEDSSPDTIETWNSLSHIHLVLALESEFSIDISPEDALEMLSVGLIHMVLEDNLDAQ